MSPEYSRPVNKEAPLDRGSGGKKDQRYKKQTAKTAQRERSKAGLSNEAGDNRGSRRRAKYQRGPGQVATAHSVMLEGGLKRLPNTSGIPKEINKNLQ